jgi:hypothetical protein
MLDLPAGANALVRGAEVRGRTRPARDKVRAPNDRARCRYAAYFILSCFTKPYRGERSFRHGQVKIPHRNSFAKAYEDKHFATSHGDPVGVLHFAIESMGKVAGRTGSPDWAQSGF